MVKSLSHLLSSMDVHSDGAAVGGAEEGIAEGRREQREDQPRRLFMLSANTSRRPMFWLHGRWL